MKPDQISSSSINCNSNTWFFASKFILRQQSDVVLFLSNEQLSNFRN